MTLLERHNDVLKSNEKLYLDMIRKDDKFHKTLDESTQCYETAKKKMEAMKVLYEKNSKSTEDRAAKVEEMRAWS